jgi:hypothetical protein
VHQPETRFTIERPQGEVDANGHHFKRVRKENKVTGNVVNVLAYISRWFEIRVFPGDLPLSNFNLTPPVNFVDLKSPNPFKANENLI